jgi:flagellar hook protein FlgE
MSQSLYTAMSGIAAATSSLQVISNNVANINTTAYKSSSVEFSDVFYQTTNSGSVATDSTGGTNPVQVGVGTQVSAVTKDFSSGSWSSTGIDSNLMIDGSGFFCVQASDGSTYYTRDGSFTFDSSGNLVTSAGYKVEGTSTILSSTTSGETVKVPLTICADVEGTDGTTMGTEKLTDLNGLGDNSNITSGNITVSVSYLNGTTTKTIDFTINIADTDLDGTVSELTSAIQSKLNAATYTDGTTTYSLSGMTVSQSDGKITFDMSGASVNDGTTDYDATALDFSTPTTNASNFITATELNGATATSGVYSSKTLDYTVTISQLSSANASISATGETINADGSIQVKYDDSSVLSVQLSDDGSTYEFIYTTSEGAGISGSKCTVDDNVASEANFVIQMATITNTDGLISVGSNLYEEGPNSGNIVYTVGGQMGAGNLQSGGVEASNVDLSDELSDMILAQRAIEANSRVFTTTSDVMSTIVQMGR